MHREYKSTAMLIAGCGVWMLAAGCKKTLARTSGVGSRQRTGEGGDYAGAVEIFSRTNRLSDRRCLPRG